MSRVVVAATVLVILAILVAWQNKRWEMVDACHARGGVWDGEVSKCRLVPARLFMGRGLQRS